MGPTKRILVVEDDDDLRALFTTTLQFAGFEVSDAADGLAALHAIDTNRPDLVVLDLRIPFISGFELQRQLAQLYTRRIPVVVVTALPADQTTGLDVECVLRKPVPPEELIQTVTRCLEISTGATSV